MHNSKTKQMIPSQTCIVNKLKAVLTYYMTFKWCIHFLSTQWNWVCYGCTICYGCTESFVMLFLNDMHTGDCPL